jgi:NAD(P)-dependent dehydrogenase (short-subunit alcohol dehydrogenase family)
MPPAPGPRTAARPAASPGARVVLLTGASAGIGRESALRFARTGDTVIGVASHAPALEELAAGTPGIEVEVCDLVVAEQRAALVERVLARHGRIDVLVNDAGVGAVVMLSSAAAWVSGPPSTVYCSSKFAVDGLVEGLRRETAGTGVLVHSINPGPVATDYLVRTAELSPQPGDPAVPAAPGVPPGWVADAVLAVAGATSPSTRSVPRAAGLVRLAQLPPVGFVLDVVVGRLAGPIVTTTRRMVDDRVRALTGR